MSGYDKMAELLDEFGADEILGGTYARAFG